MIERAVTAVDAGGGGRTSMHHDHQHDHQHEPAGDGPGAYNRWISSKISGENKHKIYVSALTQLCLDDSNRIHTTDARLLRRIEAVGTARARRAALVFPATGGEVTAVTYGPARSEAALRDCLARGAHKAVHVIGGETTLGDSFTIAKVLAKALDGREYDLVLCGNMGVGTDCAQVGPMLAELLAEVESKDRGFVFVQRQADADIGDQISAMRRERHMNED